MKRIRIGAIAALVATLLAFPAGWLASLAAVEVWIVTPHSPETVGLNQELITAEEAKDPRRVLEIYGNPVGEPIRVLFVPRDRIVHPKEMPSLAILPVDKTKGENPLQLQTVWFLARWATAGAAVVGFLLVTVLVIAPRRRVAAERPETKDPR